MTKLGNYISGIENANEKGYWELASRLFANQVKYGDTAYVILNYPLRFCSLLINFPFGSSVLISVRVSTF